MKILCGPDLHIRVTAPEHRIDDFVETQKHKIKWMMKLANKHRCAYVLLPGDITDHSRLPYYITDYYVRLFKSYEKVTILAVRGQHDMLYHVESENTPFSLMDAGEAIIDMGGVNRLFATNIGISGVSFDGEMPDIVWDLVEGQINILLIHKMFVDDKLWESQEEYERASIFLAKSKWDLIVSGDNHQHFSFFQSENRFHINCGSLMRQNIDQLDHKPVVYIYDTVTKMITPYYIPIDPPEDVFNIEAAEAKKEKDEKLEAFVEKVREDTEITGLDYVKNLGERLTGEDIKEGVRVVGKEIVKNAAERIDHR